MKLIPGGSFTMGSEQFYEEERPLRRVRVDSFWIDEKPVTNAQFAEFVEATGYRTFSEIPPNPKDYPGMDPAFAVAGSLVFTRTPYPVSLDDHSQWWAFVPGADWRHPTGPDSSIKGLEDHPVVHVAYEDADAYAKWAGKALPTEAEWEFAARGGLVDKEFAWGDELAPDGAILANYWQGMFPFATLKPDDQYRTSAAGSFPANGYGLSDMIGNVWEWTRDWYGAAQPAKGGCCEAVNPRGATIGDSYQTNAPGAKIGRRVLKGGSHLCAVNYCQRYRPAARHPQHIDSATSHIGFRCISRKV
ncbi:formylglycine-generating enzyme family protein [Sphingomonas sp. R-74633]|uniref:formylglycine-generating enzyme family protein n=1 Tax=Sphingomonas sp. R-74633 TaxID=2751188 RepID=UPI0015D3D1BF|nr:formylglycine-generating enzyme family protein [Sphingomonas sp. R-74633]NYT41479.1 formylglycine-generating enzyme family protein [Sphingomonas sp. R-74633]